MCLRRCHFSTCWILTLLLKEIAVLLCLSFLVVNQILLQRVNWMRQLLSEKCIRHELRRCFEDCDLVSSSSEWGMMDCSDKPGPQDSHSSSQVATYSEMVCAPLFCTEPNVPHGCYLAWMCVCAFVFLYERLACRGGWSGLENILCDSTSGLASLSSDIPLSLLRCNSLTVHSLCFVPVLKGMMWQPMSSANLEAYQRERWRNSVYGQKEETQIEYKVLMSLY